MVTIFALQDSVLDPANLPGSADLNRLVHDGLSYAPDMNDGLCLSTRGGGSMRITRNGADILVNGVRVSTPNVIAKNGVIHYLEGVCYPFSETALLYTKLYIQIPPAEQCTTSGTGGESSKKSASSVVVVSKMALLGLSIASFVVYLWM